MKSIGIDFKENTAINRLFDSFSLEDGAATLEKYFARVERLDYQNSLNFKPEDIDDCIFYIDKKRNLIYKEILEKMPEKFDYFQECVKKRIIEQLDSEGLMSLNKNDAVFRCFGTKK
jgi:hypothetical protein